MLNRNTLLIVVALIAVFVGSTVAMANTTSLPDSIETQILTLEAAGKFAEADSLKRQSTAAMELAARQEKAQKELEAKQAAAQKELYSTWSNEVSPLTYDEVWNWVESDTANFDAKVQFLAERYDVMTDTTESSAYQLSELISTIEIRTEIRNQVKKAARKEVAQAFKSLLDDPNSDLMKMISKIDERSRDNEADIDNIQTNLELVRQEFNKHGVAIDNMADALRYAKFDKKPKSDKFVKSKGVAYKDKPLEFPAGDNIADNNNDE